MTKTLKQIEDFLTDLRTQARNDLNEIENQNSWGAGYEVGRIDLINEIKAFLQDKEYEFGKDY